MFFSDFLRVFINYPGLLKNNLPRTNVPKIINAIPAMNEIHFALVQEPIP